MIPAAMGTFKNFPVLRSVCVPCNNNMSRLDEVILRCGPESYLLKVTTPPRRNRRGGTSSAGASGLAPPQHIIHVDGIPLVCHLMDAKARSVEIPNQLVVWNDDGDPEHVVLYRGMQHLSLLKKIQQHSTSLTPKIYKYASEEDGGWIDELLLEIWPGARIDDRLIHEPGLYPNIPGRMECVLNSDYMRAYAKIAFHYFLVCNPQYSGHEQGFDAIKTFITTGGQHSTFFRSSRTSPVYFGIPYGKCDEDNVASGEQWRHVLAHDNITRHCVVLVQLFVGPGCAGDQYYLVLNTSDIDIQADRVSRMHEFVWEQGTPSSGRVSESEFDVDSSCELLVSPQYSGYRLYTSYWSDV